jgi:hypothetical protein
MEAEIGREALNAGSEEFVCSVRFFHSHSSFWNSNIRLTSVFGSDVPIYRVTSGYVVQV